LKNVGSIRGRVTVSGVPAASVPLDLRMWNGSTMTTVRSTTTDAFGYYRFSDAPSLNSGEVTMSNIPTR